MPVHRVYIDDHTQPLEALAEAITRIEADGESVVHIEATGAGYAVVTSAKKSRQTRVTAPKETR